MKKYLTFLPIIFLFFSCEKTKIQENLSSEKAVSQKNDSVKILPPEKLDLTTTPAKPGDRSIPETFGSLSSIPKNWVEVKKDKDGYLIYNPCDGYTRTISIKDGFVEIQWEMEPAIKFYYDKFTIITGNKSFRMDLMEDISKEKSDLTAEIFDAKYGIVKFNFNNETWFVTPVENADKFRKIKNNCPDHKVDEVEFEVIK